MLPPPQVLEVAAAYPPYDAPSSAPPVIAPADRTFAAFGGGFSSSGLAPVCGPAPQRNTVNCFNLAKAGGFLGSYPLPGGVSATPQYFGQSWLFGTTKGYLMRVDSQSTSWPLPHLGKESTALWGRFARDFLLGYKPAPLYRDGENTPPPSPQPPLPQGVKWLFAGSAPFVGTPLVTSSAVYVASASQYVQSFDWQTGKLNWALRLAPESNLRLASQGLALLEDTNELLVGNSLGSLMVLDSSSGQVKWSWTIAGATTSERVQGALPTGPDKFTGVVAEPLVLRGRRVVASNAESLTEFVSLDARASGWRYPAGSVTKPLFYPAADAVILGTSRGQIVSLNVDTGRPVWSTHLDRQEPIISMMLIKDHYALAALSQGQIVLVDLRTGKLVAHSPQSMIGPVNGGFFTGMPHADACLSFASAGFRCFRVKL